MSISIEAAKKWIEENTTVPFGIKFIKRDGTLREMTCATGIKDETILVGFSMNKKPDFKARGLISVYDLDLKEYRCFDPKTLKAIKINNLWEDVVY